MTRDELVDLVTRIMAGEGTEKKHDELVLKLRHVPHPRVLDLIYYSDPPLPPTEVVDKALAYRPIAL
ncbi:bacteriocin immunity protein [Streptomyces yatensis]|uniref:E9imm peptide n=1 Tax=Streptomyces yatensis TaxID=155177 RepID=A0ABP4VC13_9ACTN|nr:bacteriocin immunity protein [Streptomyces yatensis]